MSTCKEYISGRFSNTADISEFGRGFPDFLRTTELGIEIPFLYDLARFEWVFRNAFHSENLQPLAEDMFLNALQTGARLALSPTVTLFNSLYSVYEIWKKRSEKIDGLRPDEWMKPSQLVVFKKASKVMVSRTGEMEFRILEKIGEGSSIDEVLTDLIGRDPSLNPDQVRTVFGNVGALGVLTPSLGDTRDK